MKDAMIGLLPGMLCNILLDPVFILGLGMGIKGAGYASLIGMSLAAVIVIWLSYIHGNIPVNIKYLNLKGNGRLYHILAGGAPNFSRQAITSVASVLLNLIAAQYGETLIAAMTIATRVTSLGYMLMLGEFGIYIVQPVADILSVIFAVLVVIFSWNKIFED